MREERSSGLSSESITAEQGASRPDLLPLIQRAALRDASSLARLYDLVSPVVFGLALRILGNASAAEETAIEVFAGIWDQTSRFDPAKDSPLVWIMTITRARALERLRSAGNVVSMPATVEPPPRPSAVIPNIDMWLLKESNRARGALEALPAELRRALEMAYFEGLTPEAIAQRLLVSPKTIRTRIRLGIIQLRESLGPVLRGGRSSGRD